MAYTKLIVVAAALAAMGSVSAADESAALPPAFVWKPVPGLVWKTVGSARIENGLLIAELDKVGEFSAIAWAPNAEGYIRDCIGIFEELGWDWTYHAYREFPGWSVEHEATSRGKGTENFRPSKDNPRKRVLLSGLRGELAPGGVTDKGRGQ